MATEQAELKLNPYYTPGPWSIYGRSEDWRSVVVAPCGHQVCHLTHNGKNMDGRAAGNLRMLSAATDMFAVCQLLALWDDGKGDDLLSDACSHARAAIAKVEGRS